MLQSAQSTLELVCLGALRVCIILIFKKRLKKQEKIVLIKIMRNALDPKIFLCALCAKKMRKQRRGFVLMSALIKIW